MSPITIQTTQSAITIQPTQSPITIQPTQEGDITEIIELMKTFPEVCFCEWEDEVLLTRMITQNPSVNFVAKKEGKVIGALIGGSFGVRGTISHIALAREYRYNGLARDLVSLTLDGFKSIGIRRIFLFVLDENKGAYRFWEKMGFKLTSGETTLECDL